MDAPTLVNVLTWLLIAATTALLGSIIWFAKRIVAQLDRLERLFSTETSNLDKRVTRLEDWREVVGATLRSGPKGTN